MFSTQNQFLIQRSFRSGGQGLSLFQDGRDGLAGTAPGREAVDDDLGLLVQCALEVLGAAYISSSA
jgi:hypothetical protein